MMSKKITGAIVAILLAAMVATAQNKFQKVDQWLQTQTPQLGGRTVLVVWKNGQVIYSGSKNQMTGMQKMVIQMIAKRSGKPLTTDDFSPVSRMPIASCSKWLSAALVMTFVDEGKLKLDDTVGKYLPELSANGKGNITIAECLSHQTGVKAPALKDDLAEMRTEQNMADAIKDIAAMPMEGKPGTVFRYSNVGLQIAAAVIEKISGKIFEDLFAERIAKPLNMKNTDYGHAKVVLPAGGAYSTTEDYINFLVMILNKGMYNGKRILSEQAISQMQIDRIALNGATVAYSPAEAGGVGYGFGEWVDKGASLNNPAVAVSSPGLFGSYPVIDNKKGYVAFLMTYYLKTDGRQARYAELKKLIDEAVQ